MNRRGVGRSLAPVISLRDEEGFSSCSARPCHRAPGTAAERLALLTSPSRIHWYGNSFSRRFRAGTPMRDVSGFDHHEAQRLGQWGERCRRHRKLRLLPVRGGNEAVPELIKAADCFGIRLRPIRVTQGRRVPAISESPDAQPLSDWRLLRLFEARVSSCRGTVSRSEALLASIIPFVFLVFSARR